VSASAPLNDSTPVGAQEPETRHGASNTYVRSFRPYLITTIALAIVTVGCSSHTTQHLGSPATATIHANLTRASVPDVTTAQLNAHLGVGVRSGWAPVDEGAARVFVPNGWTLLSHGSCIGDPSAVGMIGVGSLPNAHCGAGFSVTAQAAALVPSSQKSSGPPLVTIHGYRVYTIASSTPGWAFFDVPELSVEIAVHGSLGLPILATLAPSARKIALDPAYETVPTKWHIHTKDGVSLSIPSSWPVLTPSILCGPPVGNAELLLIEPKILRAPCPFQIPKAADAAHDAVALYLTSHNPNAPKATGTPTTTLQRGTTTITIYAEQDDPNALDLFVRKVGSNITHVLTLGLGRDGRIAGGVLASIRADT